CREKAAASPSMRIPETFAASEARNKDPAPIPPCSNQCSSASVRRKDPQQVDFIGSRQARMCAQAIARAKLPAVALEIFENIAAESEAVHNVAEIRRVREAKRVAGFVQAGEIDNRFAQQRIAVRGGRDTGAELIHFGQDEDLGAPLAVHFNRARLAIQARV